jgi:hypothetical protein
MNVQADSLDTEYLDNHADASKIDPFIPASRASLTFNGETKSRLLRSNRLAVTVAVTESDPVAVPVAETESDPAVTLPEPELFSKVRAFLEDARYFESCQMLESLVCNAYHHARKKYVGRTSIVAIADQRLLCTNTFSTSGCPIGYFKSILFSSLGHVFACGKKKW